jgi:hypothetical protein
VVGFFEIGSLELFALAGFKPQSSWSLASLVARITGVSYQYPAKLMIFCHVPICVTSTHIRMISGSSDKSAAKKKKKKV